MEGICVSNAKINGINELSSYLGVVMRSSARKRAASQEGIWPSNRDPVHVVEPDLIARAVIPLG